MTAVVGAVILIAAVSSIICGHHHEPAPAFAARALRAVRRRTIHRPTERPWSDT